MQVDIEELQQIAAHVIRGSEVAAVKNIAINSYIRLRVNAAHTYPIHNLELLHILDFLRTMSNIQNIDKQIFQKSKRKVFNIVVRYVDGIVDDNFSSQLFVLYCKLVALNYGELRKLGTMLLKDFEEKWEKTGKLPISIFQHCILVKSLTKKKRWSHIDAAIFDLVVGNLAGRMGEIDGDALTMLGKSLFDLDVRAETAIEATWHSVTKIQREYLKLLRRGSKYQVKLKVTEC